MSSFKDKNKIAVIIILALLFFSLVFFTGLTDESPTADHVEGPGHSKYSNNNLIEIDDFYICNIEGIIDPSIAGHVAKCLKKSREDNYGLIVTMDTPGGLEASMREIILEILNTDIPVIVFVYPGGARAASAGVFITYAADIAVMAESTSIGAAHPVNLGGEGQVSEEMMDKVLNDSVSFIRNLARSRGRNADWAEQAVRESVSITAPEALELGVIDHIASNLEELLDTLDGKTLEKSGKNFILNGKTANISELEMNFITRFLHIISNPNIAYVLFTIGMLGIVYEFSQPGLGISGAIGTLFLILGFYSFSILPVNYAGLALIILAIILFVVDILLGLGGIPSIAGIASFVLGSFLLINSDAPYLRIARSLIISASIVMAGFMIIVIRAVYMAHRQKPVSGEVGMIGSIAVVLNELNPEGQVRVDGEIWQAVSKDGKKIQKGQKVEVISLDGLTLYVKKIINQNK